MGILTILQIIADFNFLLFAFLIWRYKDKLDNSIYIFSFFLFGKGITLLSNLILTESIFADSSYAYNLGIVLNSFLFFYAPFLYLFALGVINGNISFRSHRIHFIPFFIFLVLNIALVLFLVLENKNAFLNTVLTVRNFIDRLYFLQVIGYTVASFLIVYKAEKKNIKFIKISKWLKRVLILFLFTWLLFWSNYLTEPGSYLYKIINYSGILLLLILSNTILFLILNSPEYFYNNISIKLNSSFNNEVINKENYIKLQNIITTKKLFKNSDLKIGDLSEELGISARNTSSLINSFYKSNFYDFINSYRIEEAKRILENTDEYTTILTILYDAGFNSKSVFNTTFKKVVGLTPSSYRKNHMNKKYG